MKGNKLSLMSALLAAGIGDIIRTEYELRMNPLDEERYRNKRPEYPIEPDEEQPKQPRQLTETDLERINQAEIKRQRKLNKNKRPN